MPTAALNRKTQAASEAADVELSKAGQPAVRMRAEQWARTIKRDAVSFVRALMTLRHLGPGYYQRLEMMLTSIDRVR